MPRLILHAVLLLVLAVPRIALATCPDHPIRIIGRLNAELVSIIREPEISKIFIELGIEPLGTSPGEFGKNFRAGGTLVGPGEETRHFCRVRNDINI